MRNLSKKLLNLSMLAVLVFFAAAACESINSSGENLKPDEQPEQEITARQVSNPDNPYDEIGALHNEFLDYFAAHDSGKTIAADFKLSTVRQAAVTFFEDTGRELSRDDMETWAQTLREYEQIGFPYPGESAAEFPGDPCEIYPLICELEDIMGVLKDYIPDTQILDGDKDGTPAEGTLKFIESVKSQEKKALADRELSEEQRQGILFRSAVARHSAAYWHNVKHIQQEKSGYFEYLNKQEAAGMTLGGIVRADKIGALVGGILGGPKGAFIGGAAASIAAAVS